MDQQSQLRLQLLDCKNEMERIKLIISGIKIDLNCCTNENKKCKLRNKHFYMERQLRQLKAQKNKLEKEFKSYRKEW